MELLNITYGYQIQIKDMFCKEQRNPHPLFVFARYMEVQCFTIVSRGMSAEPSVLVYIHIYDYIGSYTVSRRHKIAG